MRWLVVILLLVCTALSLSPMCSRRTGSSPPTDRIDAALARSAEYFLRAQQTDGSFRSDTYGLLKDPVTLTPHVLYTLQELSTNAAVVAARQRAATHLRTALLADRPLAHPVYTLATSISALARESRLTNPSDSKGEIGLPLYQQAHLQPLIDRLLTYQFTEQNGWKASDTVYGGWGYNLLPQQKPASPAPFDVPPDTNVSATVYALRALSDAQVSREHPAFVAARLFLAHCQNLPTQDGDPFNDGGFFFSPSDTSRNKAGELGLDGAGIMHYRSYGTMTADGLRALYYAGSPRSGVATRSAVAWLRNHFSISSQPGDFREDRELFRVGMYYYFLASYAQVAASAQAGPTDWAEQLARELLSRQQPDGSWINRYTDSREDDPLIATFHAALALARCREALVRKQP